MQPAGAGADTVIHCRLFATLDDVCDARASVSTIFFICSSLRPSIRIEGMTVPLASFVGSFRNSISRAFVQVPPTFRSPGEYGNRSDATGRLSRLLKLGAASPGCVGPK